MLRKGFLHRDISIGNVLQLDSPVRMTPFEVQPTEESTTQISPQHKDELARHADLLEVALKRWAPWTNATDSLRTAIWLPVWRVTSRQVIWRMDL